MLLVGFHAARCVAASSNFAFSLSAFNVFCVKARTRPPFGRHIIANKWNFIGILAGGCLAIFIVCTCPRCSACAQRPARAALRAFAACKSGANATQMCRLCRFVPQSSRSLTDQVVFYGSEHILPFFWFISW